MGMKVTWKLKASIMKVSWKLRASQSHLLKIYQYFSIFTPFALILFSKPQFCSLFVPAGVRDVLGDLADLERPLGKFFLIGSLLEERSKATSGSSHTPQKRAIRLPPTAVRLSIPIHRWSDCLPGRSDRQHLE
jgi:hypothetical protein